MTQAHLAEDHGVADRRAAVGFNVRRAARDGSGVSNAAHPAGGAAGTAVVGPGESFAAPDPDVDLAGGIVVAMPSTRARELGTPASASLANPTDGTNSNSSGRRGGGARGGAAAASSSSSPVQVEAFPSLPAPPPVRAQGRHAFSLVGRGKVERGDAGAAAAAVGERGGTGGKTGGSGASQEEVRMRCSTMICWRVGGYWMGFVAKRFGHASPGKGDGVLPLR